VRVRLLVEHVVEEAVILLGRDCSAEEALHEAFLDVRLDADSHPLPAASLHLARAEAKPLVPESPLLQPGPPFPPRGRQAPGAAGGRRDSPPICAPRRRDAITDAGLVHFQSAYPGEKLTKEDLFYYVYGLLHSPDYRTAYADNLGKELPRIPCVKTAQDFWAFSRAGRALAEFHLNYETVTPHPVEVVTTGKLTDASYRVEKMRYGKTKVAGKTVDDKTVLVYNEHITLKGIPLEAYDYVVNGKSALDWVVERQCVKTDKDSGILNDANAWAIETMGNPKYPLELFQRVITVSLETMKIVIGLPPLTLKEEAIHSRES